MQQCATKLRSILRQGHGAPRADAGLGPLAESFLSRTRLTFQRSPPRPRPRPPSQGLPQNVTG